MPPLDPVLLGAVSMSDLYYYYYFFLWDLCAMSLTFQNYSVQAQQVHSENHVVCVISTLWPGVCSLTRMVPAPSVSISIACNVV